MCYDQIPENVIIQLNKIYDKMKNTDEVHTFYQDFLKKQLYAFFKKDNKYLLKKDLLDLAVKIFIKKLIEEKEIYTFYHIQCLSCRKKVYGPILSLSDVPNSLKCPHCNELFNFNESYMFYDLRYIFTKNIKDHI